METPVVKAVPNERDVRVWLEGQRIAALKMEQERVRTLLELLRRAVNMLHFSPASLNWVKVGGQASSLSRQARCLSSLS